MVATKNIAIYGQERYDGTLRLCKMNLALRDLSFDVRLGDSLLQDKFPDLKADFIIVNPPFNVSQWHPEDLPENDPRLLRVKRRIHDRRKRQLHVDANLLEPLERHWYGFGRNGQRRDDLKQQR
jgi:type I restriction-modification system DNA methylase subunit